jgi:hypothetical protein
MNIIRCPECGSKFDVSAFEPGSTFACGNCKHPVEVPSDGPAEAAPRTAPPRRRPEGWGKPSSTGPVSVPGGKKPAPRAPARGKPAARGGGRGAPASRPAASPGRKTVAGGRGASRAAVPGRAASPARAAEPRRAAARPMREEEPPRRRGRRDPMGPAPANKTPLYLGLGALGLLLIVVVVVVAASSGGGGGAEEPENPTNLTAGNGGTTPKESDDPRTWSAAKLAKEWRKKKAAATNSKTACQANYDWAMKVNRPKWAREAVEWVVERIDSQDEWANKKLGNKLFEYDYMPEDPDFIEEQTPYDRKREIIEIVREGKDGKVWVEPEVYEHLQKLEDEETEHRNRIKNDVRYRETKGWIKRARVHPVYQKWDFEVIDQYSPYLVFVQKTGKEEDEAKASKIVARNAKIFKALRNTWETTITNELRRVKPDFDLPDLGSESLAPPPILKVWVFFDYENFREYLAAIGMGGLGQGIRGYYMPNDQWVTLYEGGADRGETQNIEGQSMNSTKTFHEGLHQIVHSYTRILMSEKEGRQVEFEDRRTHSRAHWFQEGLAEFFAAASLRDENGRLVTGDKGEYRMFEPLWGRLREYRMMKNAENFPNWTLEELVRVRNRGDLLRTCASKSTNPRIAGALSSGFYAHSWLLCHYFWNAEGGKYRPRFLKYMIRELHGESGFNVFREEFGDLIPGDDFTQLSEKVRAYEESLPVK